MAERRLVSVLFVDLVGFTGLAEGRDAETVRELLGRYFDLARDVVRRHGGTVEKFIGDAVMAVWGTPIAHEDDAERAVRAALEIVGAVGAIGPNVQARAGVLTGEAAVTLGAEGQGMVAGDIVNTASRLQSVAPPQTVLVGEATMRAASAAIAFEPGGEQLLKGKSAPVPAYRALRVIAERGGRGRSEMIEPPFVGREEELRLLKDFFHATARERKVRHVAVTGIAGIGKSRLAWEFLKYVDGLVETIYWHEGRSPAYGEGITFWALGEMVRRQTGLAEADDERTTREKVAASLAEFVPDENERRWIEPRLLALLGIGEPPSGGREELFATWRTFFERIAAVGTVVLVFEDLQWADPGLLDFIDHLIEWSRDVPIYIVTLARPELLDRKPDWAAGRRNFVAIHLDPLPDAAMRFLLAGLAPRLPGGVVEKIVARSEGVPLYAVETIRMLVADGTLVAEGSTYRPTREAFELAVPESLHELIGARLDGLAAAERSVLLDAAVLGQTFTVAALSAVAGLDGVALERLLRSLARREFLQVVADPRSPERGQYTFLQGLICEVAYGRLAKRERRARHLAAARHFETLEDEEIAGVLASHYLAAYQASPEGAEADAAAAQARVALKAAAERASGLGSPGQAFGYLEQALSTASEPDDRAELLWRAGVAASEAGRHDDAERYLMQAVELNRERGDRLATVRAIAALGGALVEGFRVERATEILEAAVSEFAELSEEPPFAAILGHLARAFQRQQLHEVAVRYAERALPTAERRGLHDVLAATLVTKGMSLHELGRSVEGTALMEAGFTAAESKGLTGVALRAQANLLRPLSDIDMRAALERARNGLDSALRFGRPVMIVYLLENAAELALDLGDWDWARERLAERVAAITDPVDRAHLVGLVADYGALRGEDVSEEIAELERTVATSPDQSRKPLRFHLNDARFWRAIASSQAGDAAAIAEAMMGPDELSPEDALPRAVRASLWANDVERARRASDRFPPPDPTKRYAALLRRSAEAGILALSGQPEVADAYRDALRGLRDAELRFPHALTVIDALMFMESDDAEVRSAAAEAREFLTRVGSQPLLEKLNAALAAANRRRGGAVQPEEAAAAAVNAGGA